MDAWSIHNSACISGWSTTRRKEREAVAKPFIGTGPTVGAQLSGKRPVTQAPLPIHHRRMSEASWSMWVADTDERKRRTEEEVTTMDVETTSRTTRKPAPRNPNPNVPPKRCQRAKAKLPDACPNPTHDDFETVSMMETRCSSHQGQNQKKKARVTRSRTSRSPEMRRSCQSFNSRCARQDPCQEPSCEEGCHWSIG